MAIIMKDSIVIWVECRALSTNLTVACCQCKSDIVFIYFSATYQALSSIGLIIDQLFYFVTQCDMKSCGSKFCQPL